jgi:hypothetical protein
LVDTFCATDATVMAQLDAAFISPSRVCLLPDARDPEGQKAVARAHQDVYGQLLATRAG